MARANWPLRNSRNLSIQIHLIRGHPLICHGTSAARRGTPARSTGSIPARRGAVRSQPVVRRGTALPASGSRLELALHVLDEHLDGVEVANLLDVRVGRES